MNYKDIIKPDTILFVLLLVFLFLALGCTTIPEPHDELPGGVYPRQSLDFGGYPPYLGGYYAIDSCED